MTKCEVEGCSTVDGRQPGRTEILTMFAFPKNDAKRFNHWVSATGKTEAVIKKKKTPKICSLHFATDSLDKEYLLRRSLMESLGNCHGKPVPFVLKKDALPTLQLGTTSLYNSGDESSISEPQPKLYTYSNFSERIIPSTQTSTPYKLGKRRRAENESTSSTLPERSTRSIGSQTDMEYPRSNDVSVRGDCSMLSSQNTTVENLKSDPDYDPATDDNHVHREADDDTVCSDDLELDAESDDEDACELEYFVVHKSQLQQLLKYCHICGYLVESVKYITNRGAMLKVNSTCINSYCNRDTTWNSSEVVDQQPLLNIALSGALFYSGMLFEPFSHFCKNMGLKINGKTTPYKIIKAFVRPVVRNTWVNHRRDVINKENAAADNDPKGSRILQDGQYDSPGFCAWSHTHSSQLARTNEICDIIIKKKDPNDPGDMEVKCSRVATDRLDKELNHLTTVCTDRHRSIIKMMREEFSHLEHGWDLWHIGKTFRKRFAALAKQKRYAEIAPWQQAIIRHLWYSAANCNENPEILVETFTSCLRHIRGEHEWDNGVHVHRCAHDLTEDDDAKQRAIFDEDMEEYKALVKLVKDPTFIKDLSHAHHNLHTGKIESYHSLRLMYLPKRVSFSWDGTVDRSILAALDNNHNVARDEIGLKLYYSKATQRWVYRVMYSPKSDAWRKSILRATMDVKNIPKAEAYEEEFTRLFGCFNVPSSSVPKSRPTGSDLPTRQQRLQVHTV